MPRRAQPGLLLLMAAVAVAVAPGAPCAAPAAACLPSCAPNIALKQCLHYLQESHKDELCGRDLSPGRRRDELEKLRLRHCCEHRVAEALPEAAFHDSRICRLRLQELLETDHLASHASCSHADLLLRYDCAQNYSIAFNCDQCKVAYRRWICSELVPFYVKGGQVRIPPCLRLCQDVEQQCPYLLPDQTLTPSEAAHPTPQYAGEPNFLCLDPNIPRLEERPNSTGDEDCCYTHCGAPGRGRPADLYSYVCDRCPSRPTNGTQGSTTEIEEENRRRSTATGIGTPTSGTRTSIGPVSWWMWWTFLILTLRAGARLNDLINFFIVGTANSVRTVPECGC